MGKLEGQVAIVTGGGTGIGRETARLLAAEGARVVVVGRRKPPLDLVVGEIEAAGGQAVARQADVSSLDEAAALGAWACQTYGRVDVLVNNAGHSSPNRTVWVEHEDWSRVVDVNLNGTFALTRAVLPTMVERATMMQSDDVARAILFCVPLPPRTVVEEIVMSPTLARDHSAEIATARRLGEPARR